MFDNKCDPYWDKTDKKSEVTKVTDIPFDDFCDEAAILRFVDASLNRSGLFDTGCTYWKEASRVHLFDILNYIKKTKLSAEQNIESVIKLLKMDKASLTVLLNNFHKNYGVIDRNAFLHDIDTVYEPVSKALLRMFE